METVWGCYSELPALFPPPTATRAGGPGLVCRGRSYGREGRVPEMAESSPDKYAYENKRAERFGGQKELEFVVPTPSGIPAPEMKEAAH